jgi:iron(III) transport system substrate-binding protein
VNVPLKLAALAIGACALLACKSTKREVVVYTSVDQPFAEPIFREFEKRSGIQVRAVFDTEETKSTGVLNRLVAEAQRPQADVFWSGDPVRPFLLAKRGLLDPYVSPAAATVPAQFKSADGLWTGAAARARILLVNTQRVAPSDMPRSVRDLANPRWKGQGAMANPVFGTTTIYVAALFTVWGDDRAKAFLEQVKANETRIASSNGEVRRLVAAGEVAFGLTDTDDAHEALQDKAPVQVVYPDQDDLGTLVMPNAVVLIRGGTHPAEARALIDYLVSPEVEKRMTDTTGHIPLRRDAAVTPGTPGPRSFRTMQVDYARVADEIGKIEPWLRQWAGF